MPFPILAAAGAASSLAGSLINSANVARQNRLSQQFSREMYDRQYTDSLNFWNLQNEYNSPQNQMKRFRDAGLNPHLIYGQGNAGNAGSIPTPDVQSAQFRSPDWGNAVSGAGLGAINMLYDLEIKKAQADNLKAQNTVITEEGLLRAAQVESTHAGTSLSRFNLERGRFNLDLDKDLRETSADYRREQLRQLRTLNDVTLHRDAREATQNVASVAEAYERMKNLAETRLNLAMSRAHSAADIARIKADTDRIRQSTSVLEKENTLKQLDIDLRRNGINPNDPLWSRLVGRILTDVFGFDLQSKPTPPDSSYYRFDSPAYDRY